ncbi:50S ribosomal protein L4 [Candidatus Dojkabacteria bacterium]|uniref:Large ribosomal subunit protein uL4 n=1 Tax=Candidatus Dojkabacteria bacterium TaxID=2099670 RepID=A0A955I6X9_9BACT|nr:50S ribosomal protein L4 [Candidatus Dojkabacteria bacterium]
MKLDIYAQTGKKTSSKAEVPDNVFGAKVNKSLMSQYVFVYLSNQRASIAHAKDRSEVSGGGVKPWKQKGTGRARAGSNRSPIWTKGGVTFGPTKNRNWKKEMNKKMRRGALCSALSSLVKDEKLKIVDKINLKEAGLTKQATEIMQNFGSPRKVLVVTNGKQEAVINAFANIPNAKVAQVGELNAYDVINAGEVLFLADAVDYTNKWTNEIVTEQKAAKDVD